MYIIIEDSARIIPINKDNYFRFQDYVKYNTKEDAKEALIEYWLKIKEEAEKKIKEIEVNICSMKDCTNCYYFNRIGAACYSCNAIKNDFNNWQKNEK